MSESDKNLEIMLAKARMNYSVRKFKRMANLISTAAAVAALAVILIVSLKFHLALVFVPLAIVVRMVVKKLIFVYPALNVKLRKGKIDLYLPHAVNMMLGMISGGADIFRTIKTVAEAKGIFYELSEEFQYVCKLCEDLKMDFRPCITFQELLRVRGFPSSSPTLFLYLRVRGI